MSFQHSNVYIVRVKDTTADGETTTWFAGPYGSTAADQAADAIETAPNVGRVGRSDRERECFVEALYSDNDCLIVQPYGRRDTDSLY